MNPFLATDGYKTGHHKMYPKGTTLVYSNFTPRSFKHAPKECKQLTVFGTQMVFREIEHMFNEHFFKLPKPMVCGEIKREYEMYLGGDFDVSHIEELWEYQRLPIKVKALPEGIGSNPGIPVLTIVNTQPQFFWITNFIETLISNLLWKPMTSASLAYAFKEKLSLWANKTDKENLPFVDFQGHDFSMRGLDSVEASCYSGLGHAASFLGSDSLPVIKGARVYYGEEGPVVHSVNATEHSVMCAGTKDDEIGTFRHLMEQFPTGILSIVSDTWDLWKVCTEILPQLKDEIMARDGKIVIRPDSGDPVDILCGTTEVFTKYSINSKIGSIIVDGVHYKDNGHSHNHRWEVNHIVDENPRPSEKGVIELLWDTFGGTINEQGYKVLDSHIGAIYGDSINLDRAEQICTRLESKGFASTNVVLGIGSFTYQYNTRDTFGFAMKATYVEGHFDDCVGKCKEDDLNGEKSDICRDGCVQASANIISREIFKDPITDDGTKKSAKGLLKVDFDTDRNYVLLDQQTWEQESEGQLETIFENGKWVKKTNLAEIRERINKRISNELA
jgi:nicotinamide phosphoribosyltransferase